MKSSDICFYMSITKEENSSLLIAASAQQNIPEEDLGLTSNLTRKLSFRRSIAGPKNFVNNLKNNCEIPLIKSSTSIYKPNFDFFLFVICFFLCPKDKTPEIRIELEENGQLHAANNIQTASPSRIKSIDKENDTSEYLIWPFPNKKAFWFLFIELNLKKKDISKELHHFRLMSACPQLCVTCWKAKRTCVVSRWTSNVLTRKPLNYLITTLRTSRSSWQPSTRTMPFIIS